MHSFFIPLFALMLGHAAVAAPESPTAATAAPGGANPPAAATLGTVEKKSEGPTTKFNALLQAWTVSDAQSAAQNNLNFRLRRAELRASGNVVPQMRYFVMLDAAKAINPQGDNRVLQDLGVGVTVVPGLEVVAGQFKILTNAESLVSSTQLLFPERSVTSRFYGDRREPGLMVSYETGIFKLGAMASNGEGTNGDAKKTKKDFSVRGDVKITKDITAGVYGFFGDFEYNKKGSWGVNGRFNPTAALSFGAEVNMGRLDKTSNMGFVVDAGYMVTPEIQPVVRHEVFQPNRDKTAVAQQSTLGVNYLLSKHNAKFQAAISVLSNMKSDNGSPRGMTVGANGPMGTLVFQAAL